MKEPFASASKIEKQEIVDAIKKRITSPQPIKKRENRPQRATIAERQEAAACFEEILPEETFAWYLLCDSSRGTLESEEVPGNQKSVQVLLQAYVEGLLQIERDIYTYCDQRDIVKRIRTGRFLLESIKRIFEKRTSFGRSELSPDVRVMYDTVRQQLEEQQKKDTAEKEQTFLILYNSLLLAQNAFMAAEKGPIVFCSTTLDLPFVFEKLEKQLCPKSTLEKQYQASKKYLSEKKTGTAKRQTDDIVLYHSFVYVRMASAFVYEYVNLLGML